MRYFPFFASTQDAKLLVRTELLADNSIIVEYGEGFEDLAGTRTDDLLIAISRAINSGKPTVSDTVTLQREAGNV